MPASTGQLGEQAAEAYLLKSGYSIRERNFTKRPFGEIDIVAEKDEVLCFVEVKTSKFVPYSKFVPEMRISREKVRRMKRICEVYLREYDLFERKWRIDVISVILGGDDNAVWKLEHFKNAVFEKSY